MNASNPKRSTFCLVAALSLLISPFAWASASDDILALVQSRGAREAVSVVWGDEDSAESVLEGVSTGSADWLEVAKALSSGTDASSAEELNAALAKALVNQPYMVLPWLQHEWWGSGRHLCVFDKDSELRGGVPNYVERLEQALRAPAPARVARLRKQCLKGLYQTRKALLAGNASLAPRHVRKNSEPSEK